jgi:guanidinopropionase
MRLPVLTDSCDADIAMVGLPWDGGTTNRSGPRDGPRQVREMSSLLQRLHAVTTISPYEICRVADLGDALGNPMDLDRSLGEVRKFFSQIVEAQAVPLAIGGEHSSSLPILRAVRAAHPV